MKKTFVTLFLLALSFLSFAQYPSSFTIVKESPKPSFESFLQGIKYWHSGKIYFNGEDVDTRGQDKSLLETLIVCDVEKFLHEILPNASENEQLVGADCKATQFLIYDLKANYYAYMNSWGTSYVTINCSIDFYPLSNNFKYSFYIPQQTVKLFDGGYLYDALVKNVMGYKQYFSYSNVLNLKEIKTGLTENILKKSYDTGIEHICEGIYEAIADGDDYKKYKLGVKYIEGKLYVIYLNGAMLSMDWNEGDLKATLESTATPNFYKVDWIAEAKNSTQGYISFEQGFMKTIFNGETKLYLKLYPTATDIVVNEKSESWSGSGFAINNGYLVTNWHVAENARTIYVYGIRGDFSKKYIAEVVAKDKNNDLAILKISGNGFPGFGTIPYKIKTGLAEVAEDIWVLGFPLTAIMGDEVKYTDGRISALSGFDGDVSMYQISAPIQNGNSGGPVFDENGNVIGIACAGIDNRVAQNANYAVKASYLKSLADAMQITNVMPTNSQITSYTRRQDKVKLAKNFVFYIECCDKELPLEGVTNRPSYINVSPTSLSFSEKQGSKTLTISTNAPSWKVVSKPDWCTTTGKTATTVTINVTNNASCENRSGTILLETSDGRTNSVLISQSNEWIDLGLPSGTLWKDKNEGERFYTYDEAISKFGNKLPTKKQMEELKNYCQWIWIGNGYKVVGPSGRFIVMQAMGYCGCNGNIYNVGGGGYYWSSTPSDSGDAWRLDFNSGKVYMDDDNWCDGRSVRTVLAK